MKNLTPVFTLLILFFSTQSYEQPGSLDQSFGTSGIATRPHLYNGSDWAGASVLQPDGKIIVGGGAISIGYPSAFTLARFDQFGQVDNTFGSNGRSETFFGGDNISAYINALALQPDGKIVAAGAVSNGMTYYFAIARYHPDGTLDTTFNHSGYFIDHNSLPPGEARAVFIRPDGKIIITGYAIPTPGHVFFAAFRFSPDGMYDGMYAAGGVYDNVFQNYGANPVSATIQPDGKILLVGGDYDPQHKLAILRCNLDGSLDNSFGTGGVATAPGLGNSSWIQTAAVQPDGKIVASVSITEPSGSPVTLHSALIRFNPDGTQDANFGVGGLVYSPSGPSYMEMMAISVQSNGKIVVAASTANGSNYNFMVMRYKTDGSLDSTFASNGVAVTDPSDGENDFVASMFIQPDGKIVVVGTAYNQLGLVRYQGDLHVGVQDLTVFNPAITLYPNPVVQHATVAYSLEKPETISIQLVDLQGRVLKIFLEHVARPAGLLSEEIDLPQGLPAGVYSVVVYSDKKQVAVKLVKTE
jgi:uncharacterized delta-60 repeat protein